MWQHSKDFLDPRAVIAIAGILAFNEMCLNDEDRIYLDY